MKNNLIQVSHLRSDHRDISIVGNDIYTCNLGLHPTVNSEILKAVNNSLDIINFRSIEKLDLPDNGNIVSSQQMNIDKIKLLEKLTSLKEKIGGGFPILFVRDNCFTNNSLDYVLKKILGEDGYNNFVKIIPIDYDSEPDNQYQKDNINNNSLILLGGSLSDTYNFKMSHYHSYLANLIKKLSSDFYTPPYIDNKFLGVCFGNQYLANIIGMNLHDSTNVIATIKGHAQFGASKINFLNYHTQKGIFKSALNGLSNNGQNDSFTSFYTRTGHVKFDLLGSQGRSSIITLLEDEITGGTVGWGTNNGNMLGVQFHPEFPYVEKSEFNKTMNIVEEIIMKYFVGGNTYIKPEKLLKNFEDLILKNDIGEAFYLYSISAFVDDLLENLGYYGIDFLTNPRGENQETNYGYNEALKNVKDEVSDSLKNIINHSEVKTVRDFLQKIDEMHKLQLNNKFDRKVSRTIKEASEVLGITDLGKLILDYKNYYRKNKVTLVRDLGAGDGSTMTELYNTLKGNDIVFYGVSDDIYVDLYSGLKNNPLISDIPDQVLVLFIQKTIEKYNELREKNTEATVLQILRASMELISFKYGDKINYSSMFSDKTAMFSSENVVRADKDTINYIHENTAQIDYLKKLIGENFYHIHTGYLDRIFTSKFNELSKLSGKYLDQVDFQYAVKSSSHLNSEEYKKFIYDYVLCNKDSGFFIDNGVCMSYTFINRLDELSTIKKLERNNTRFRLIYDVENKSFNSVVIEKNFNASSEELNSDREYTPKVDIVADNLGEGKILVDLDEASNATYFRIETFVRKFLLKNFKNTDVFDEFRDLINSFFTQIYKILFLYDKKIKQNKDTVEKDLLDNLLKQLFLDLVNTIAEEYVKNGIHYEKIDMEVLLNYDLDGVINDDLVDSRKKRIKNNLENLLKTEFYQPEWFRE